ncbi:hypothetical protein DS884_15700 [Tenacibaculum sp. E3R01]|uniref:hypothetical protein n=1 Tax=Tenacibaculum sp. E3R01 TaxID=2267227 RepID=UPI000DEA063E|nr:hypothetical protein [Tenacibaculum sp. E3R01]RBW55794.1 hypothetical protein DS884_15700 [Tenacibaculum sp. E3R01]
MNTEKIKTLDQILDSIEIIENARSINDLSQEDRLRLEKASLQLRNLVTTIIREKTKKLIEILNRDTNKMKSLIEKMQISNKKLAGVAKSLEKVTNIIESLVNITSQALLSGLV